MKTIMLPQFAVIYVMNDSRLYLDKLDKHGSERQFILSNNKVSECYSSTTLSLKPILFLWKTSPHKMKGLPNWILHYLKLMVKLTFS